MRNHEFKFCNLTEIDAADVINEAGRDGFKFAGVASDVAILSRPRQADRAMPGVKGNGLKPKKSYEFLFYSLHEIGAADAINEAGGKGYKLVGTSIDLVILSRQRRDGVKD